MSEFCQDMIILYQVTIYVTSYFNRKCRTKSMTNDNCYCITIFTQVIVHHYKELLTREQMDNGHCTEMYQIQWELLRYGG